MEKITIQDYNILACDHKKLKGEFIAKDLELTSLGLSNSRSTLKIQELEKEIAHHEKIVGQKIEFINRLENQHKRMVETDKAQEKEIQAMDKHIRLLENQMRTLKQCLKDIL